MGRKYKIRDQDRFYFVTFTVIQWIDIFTREAYRDIVIDSIKHCQKHKKLEVGAWCIMTNHIHLILRSCEEFPLEGIIRDLKSFTSRELRKAITKNIGESRKSWILKTMIEAGNNKSNNKDWQLWMQHNHPIELDTSYLIDQKMEYIHENPVKAGFVENPEHWLYSSARDYYMDQPGLLDIYYLD